MLLNLTIKIVIDTDQLEAAREAVLRCWTDDLGIEYHPIFLDQELTHDEELVQNDKVGLVEAHNILLNLRRCVANADWSIV